MDLTLIQMSGHALISANTIASLRGMVFVGTVCIAVPFFFGLLFGNYILASILPAAVLSGVFLAMTAGNTGVAMERAGVKVENDSRDNTQGKALLGGKEFGDGLRDSVSLGVSGMVKFMCVVSFVFCYAFYKSKWFADDLWIN